MTDGHIDEAIDRAVREMMSVESHASVRPRVLARLGRPGRPIFTPLRMALAGASAILVAFILIDMPWPDKQTERAVAGALVPAPVAGGLEGSAGAPERLQDPRPAPPAAGARPARNAVATVDVETADAIPPLEEMDALVVSAPQLTDIEPAAVIIAPLATIPDVVVEPLPFPPGAWD